MNSALNEVQDESQSTVPRKRVIAVQYLLLHWRGRLPLAASYWINSGLLTLVAYVVIGIGAEVLRRTTTLGAGIVGKLAFFLMAVMFVWGAVGTWRSGTVYDRTSKWPFGAYAKFLLLITAVRLCYSWL